MSIIRTRNYGLMSKVGNFFRSKKKKDVNDPRKFLAIAFNLGTKETDFHQYISNRDQIKSVYHWMWSKAKSANSLDEELFMVWEGPTHEDIESLYRSFSHYDFGRYNSMPSVNCFVLEWQEKGCKLITWAMPSRYYNPYQMDKWSGNGTAFG